MTEFQAYEQFLGIVLGVVWGLLSWRLPMAKFSDYQVSGIFESLFGLAWRASPIGS